MLEPFMHECFIIIAGAINFLLFLANMDYRSLHRLHIFWSFGSSSGDTRLLTVSINSDDLTELTEFFVVIINEVILLTRDGYQPTLTAEERSRISLVNDSARVFIFDTDSKAIIIQCVYVC